MVHLVCLFVKMHLLALLQNNSHDFALLFLLMRVICIGEEYNSVLLIPTEADKTGYFGQ